MSVQKGVELCPCDKLSSRLHNQKRKGRFCDMDLNMCNVRFPVHSCVVESASRYIEKLLGSCEDQVMLCKFEVLVDLSDEEKSRFCRECAEKVVDFMYCCPIQVEENHIPHIHDISKALEITELDALCQSSLNDKVDCVGDAHAETPENAVLIHIPKKSSDEVAPGSAYTNINHNALGQVVNPGDGESYLEPGWAPLESASLTCPKCKDTFTNAVMLQQHCNSHFGKFYTCYVCNYSTLKVPHLLKHLKDVNHLETVCSLCLYEADTNFALQDHLNEHDRMQPFFCRTCKNRFQTRTALNSHIVKHSTETPFICSVCGRGFKWKQSLQNHMFIHTSIKNHLCDECGYSTAHLKSFQDHKTIHSGKKFKCPISACEFSSARKDSVKHHLSTHSKEKSYQCEVCGRAFSQAKNLRRHAAIHDPAAEPAQCLFCSFKTMRSDKFRDHLHNCYRKRKNDVNKIGKDKTNEETSAPISKTNRNSLEEVKSGTLEVLKTDSQQTFFLSIPSDTCQNSSTGEQVLRDHINNSVDTPEEGVISLAQDQVNFVVCDSMPVELKSLTPKCVQFLDSTIPVFQHCDKPLVYQGAVGSEVEISCDLLKAFPV